MKWWKFSGKKSGGSGWFQYYNLYEWWDDTFTEKEQQYILDNYKPLGGSSEELIKGDFHEWKTSKSDIALLIGIAGNFISKEDRHIAYKFILKAESLIKRNSPIIDVHFLYQTKLQTYYKDRTLDDSYLNTAIQACKDQIALSSEVAEEMLREWGSPLPTHAGYTQLAIVHEKKKDYIEAIAVCKSAMQQGWNGDWEKRIARLQKKFIS